MNVCSGNEALVLLVRKEFPEEEIFAVVLPGERSAQRIVRCVKIQRGLPEELAASFSQPDPRRVLPYNGDGRISGEVALSPGGDVCDIVASWAEALGLDYIPTFELVVTRDRGAWRVLCEEASGSPAPSSSSLGVFAFLV